MEDESFSSWYRKTAGMHTIKAWCEKYNKHPYAWGALIMIHGVDEVSARLRSKVENYAVYSAVLLSASVVLLSMNEVRGAGGAMREANRERGWGEGWQGAKRRVEGVNYSVRDCIAVGSLLTPPHPP